VTSPKTPEEKIRNTIQILRRLRSHQWQRRRIYREMLGELLEQLLEENPDAVKKLLMETFQ